MTYAKIDTVGRARLRPLAGVLAALLVAHSGTRISAIAIPWFVLVTTGSATQTGLVAFCEMGPYVAVKAFAGPLVDRIGPRRISWIADVVSAAAALLIPLLHAEDMLSFKVLLGLVAVIGTVRSPGDLAKDVMIPEAAELSRVPLERATGLQGVFERLAGTVGPAAGGTLVGLVGPMVGLGVNAVCFALGSLIIAAALPRGMGRPQKHPAEKGEGTHDVQDGYWHSFRQGFAFLRRQPVLLTLYAMLGITNLLDAAYVAVLIPVWAKGSGYGPATIGLVLASFSITATVGSLIAATVAHRLRRRPVFFLGWLVAGAPRFLILTTDAPLWCMAVVIGIGGLGGGFINPIIGAVTYERIPPEMMGRVQGIGDAITWAGIPLGGLLAGAAVAGMGLAPALLTAGAVYFLTTNLTGLRPEWREMDRHRGKGRAGRSQPASSAS
ncbi:MFS transporter [Streptomyces sp. NBC_00846]|uniref:MFS transporter n=1 Tax=Streptomyces sp. NBC_00846 TaxID=2975849 RepID=UPI003864707B|nr:MFS transporter [Streptomyces sp. NBC_00846]